MSWLLVAFIPGLLMLATFGLDRLEAGLDEDTVSPTDVAALLERARADCARPAAHTGDEPSGATYSEYVISESAQAFPTRVLIHHRANPEVQPTRHAYRV